MSKAIKLKNNNYFDSSAIKHNRKTLNQILNNFTTETPSGSYSNKAKGKIDINEYVIMIVGFKIESNSVVVNYPYSTSGLTLMGIWFTSFYNNNASLQFSYSGVNSTSFICNARTATGGTPSSNSLQAICVFRNN